MIHRHTHTYIHLRILSTGTVAFDGMRALCGRVLLVQVVRSFSVMFVLALYSYVECNSIISCLLARDSLYIC